MNKTSRRAYSLLEISIVILIIAILTAGILQSNKLTGKIKLNSARSQSISSGILAIEDMALWLDATNEIAITSSTNGANFENGDKISSWNDVNKQLIAKSDAVQGTDTQRPLYSTNSLSGLPSLKFDGTDDNFSTNNVCDKNFTAFAIFRTAVSGTSGQATLGQPILWADASTNGYDTIPMAVGGGFAKIFNGSADSTLTGSKSVINDAAHLITTSRNLVTGARTIYVDGVADGSDSNGAANKILNDNTSMLIGGNTINAVYFNGYIGEIIVYSRALSYDERRIVEKYLGKKWGIKII
jgi:prepilin-type N-terminal cleavage/methylation domain-containing protein